MSGERVHLDVILCDVGVDPNDVAIPRFTTDLEEVTCPRCRVRISEVGEAFMRARRNGGVTWLAGSARGRGGAVAAAAHRILEELDHELGTWRRFDLRRWVARVPVGEHDVTLRVREGKGES